MAEHAKATRAQMIQRIEQVYQWLLDGETRSRILEMGMSTWGVSEHSIEAYIQDARKDLNRLSSATKQEMLAFVIGNLIDLVKKTRNDNKNYSCFLGALSQLSKITGLEKIVVEMPKDEMPEVHTQEALSELKEDALH